MKISNTLFALVAICTTPPVVAQAKQPRSLDEVPCPQMPVVSPERMALIVEPKPAITRTPPASAADRARYMNWAKLDPDGICRYRQENSSLPPATSQRVVFIGDSITEAWRLANPALFSGDRLDRGVSGETTTQMLARFRTDVIDLNPSIVHIMGGINDIAAPPGTSLTRSNIESMVELAQAHGITVILGAVTPSSLFQGAPDLTPGPHIVWLDGWLRDYAERKGLIYVDYYAPLQDGKLGIKAGLSNDGLHPNRRGYDVMTPLTSAAIDRAFRSRVAQSTPR